MLHVQVGPGEAGAEVRGDPGGDALSWKAWHKLSHTGNLALVSTSKYVRVALLTSRRPETPPSTGGGNGSAWMGATAASGRQRGRTQCR
jgi:hypothetical protein